MKCSYDKCREISVSFKCSKCKSAFYCGREHQSLHWKDHKKVCDKSTKKICTRIQQGDVDTVETEGRECCCMFCGKTLIFQSESEAIAHMENCTSLQFQLSQTTEPFSIPPDILHRTHS